MAEHAQDQSNPRCQLRVTDYKVAWISALFVEQAAATAMMDEEHTLPEDFCADPQDTNLYTFGRVGDHNVVFSCLAAGQYGTVSAAWQAANLTRRFPCIKAGFLVGIAGGVPNGANDVRLGDVAISTPNGTNGGVVSYDLGKATPEGFARTGSLSAPPRIILNALNLMRALEMTNRSAVSRHLSVFDMLPDSPFNRNKAGPDILYEDGKPKERPPRKFDGPAFHYGTIASGNRVIKDSSVRDEISKSLGNVVAFEMEAAGIMNDFPGVAIRGICDYADEHKNKGWQAYAAAAAAAYAKALLEIIHPLTRRSLREANESTEIRFGIPDSLPKVADSGGTQEMMQFENVDGGPRRGHRKHAVRGVIKEETPPSSGKTASDRSTEESGDPMPKSDDSETLLWQIPRPKSFITFSDRSTIKFYGHVYLGNGMTLRNVVNNQGGTISNTVGSMNLGIVTGQMSSTGGRRGYMTRAFAQGPKLQSIQAVFRALLSKKFKGRG